MPTRHLSTVLFAALVLLLFSTPFTGGFGPGRNTLFILLSAALLVTTRGAIFLAWRAWRRGDFDRLEQLLGPATEARRHTPRLADLHDFLRGALYRERGDWAAARPLLDRVATRHWLPGSILPIARIYAAEVALAMGDVAAAREHYTRARRGNSYLPDTEAKLAALAARIGIG